MITEAPKIAPTIDDVADMFRHAMTRMRDNRTLLVSRTDDGRFLIQGMIEGTQPVDVTKHVMSEFRRSHPLGY